MAFITKLTHDAKLKLGIKDGHNSSFTATFKKVTSEELKSNRNPSYTYLI